MLKKLLLTILLNMTQDVVKMLFELFARNKKCNGRDDITFTGVSLTKQDQAEDCDIKKLVQHMQLGYEVPVNPADSQFYDATAVPSYQESLNRIAKAKEYMDTLPVSLQKRFNYDVSQMLDFISNPDTHAEAVKYGLKEEIKQETTPSPSIAGGGVIADEKETNK
jgi:Chlamydia-phage Chp2 scaffold (Chlamy_scaf)